MRNVGLGLAAIYSFLSALGLALLARVLTPRRKGREARIACAKGVMRVRAGGLLSQTVLARDVLGAALSSKSIALCTKRRRGLPLEIECATSDDLQAIRDALGIGSSGIGTVECNLRVQPIERMDVAMRGLLVLSFILGLAIWPHHPRWLDTLDNLFIVAIPLTLVLYIVRRAWPRDSIELYESGFSVRAPGVRAAISFREVAAFKFEMAFSL